MSVREHQIGVMETECLAQHNVSDGLLWRQ